jgi:hypothetical protein
MEPNTLNPHTYYARQGQVSDPGEYAHHLDALPDDLPGIITAIQGVMLHLHWATRYGVTLNRVRQEEVNLRSVRDRLAKIFELQDTPLTEPRPLSKKTAGTCRDFTLLLTSILRHQGIPPGPGPASAPISHPATLRTIGSVNTGRRTKAAG